MQTNVYYIVKQGTLCVHILHVSEIVVDAVLRYSSTEQACIYTICCTYVGQLFFLPLYHFIYTYHIRTQYQIYDACCVILYGNVANEHTHTYTSIDRWNRRGREWAHYMLISICVLWHKFQRHILTLGKTNEETYFSFIYCCRTHFLFCVLCYAFVYLNGFWFHRFWP